jgi:predicted lipid carrier protein YhbT
MSAVPPRTLDQAVDWLRVHFRPDAAQGLDACYQLHLSGRGGGEFYVRVKDGVCEVARGTTEPVDTRLRLPASDLFDLLARRANADLLVMEGRLEIEGDLARANRLRALFRAHA